MHTVGRCWVFVVVGVVAVVSLASAQALQEFTGHVDWVRTVAFSSDGTLASGSDDGTIILWDVAEGQQLRVLRGHAGYVYSVAWSPDGQQLVSGSDDGTVRLWEAATGRVLHVLSGHTGSVNAVAFAPDGQTVASGSDDDTVRTWDVATGRELLTLRGHEDWVRAVAFSADGRLLASGSDDYTVRIWDVTKGTARHVLEGHLDWVRAVAFSPDGRTVASGADDFTVRTWDTSTGQALMTLDAHNDWVRAVAFSPDGRRLASGADDRAIILWDAHTGDPLGAFFGHTDFVRSVAFSPNGMFIASGSDDMSVRLWDATAPMSMDLMPRECDYVEIRSVSVSPTVVPPGGTLTVSFEYLGTGPYYGYAFRWASTSDGGPAVTCNVDQVTPCEWHTDSLSLRAPAEAGTYTWYVMGYGGASGSRNLCGGGYDDAAAFTFEVAGDAAPPDPTVWQEARAGDVCLMVPADWYDLTLESKDITDDDEITVLGSWSVSPSTWSTEAVVEIYEMTYEELSLGIQEGEEDDAFVLIDHRPGTLAGQPAVWRAYILEGEVRMWLAHQAAPRPNGRYLVLVAGTEVQHMATHGALLQHIFDSMYPCAETRADADTPTTGTIQFALHGERFSFPATGQWDPEANATLIAGGSRQATVSLVFAGNRVNDYTPTFFFQWLEGPAPFTPNVPSPTYMAAPGFFPITLTVTEYGAPGDWIRGSFEGGELEGRFEVVRTR